GFAGIGEVGGTRRNAVRHLVAGDVDVHERIDRTAVAIAEGHAEAAVGPEGVGVAASVVHAAQRALAVVGDAVTGVDVLVVIPGLRDAVMRIGGNGGGIGRRAVAPHVVGIGEQRAGSAGTSTQVGGVSTATAVVLHLVGAAAALLGRDRDASGKQRLARPGRAGDSRTRRAA